MQLSIVSTLYKSEAHLAEFIERMVQAAKQITQDFELILVNDGSPDRSLEIALSARDEDDRIKIIDLSRNFGHHRAIMTGLRYTSGKSVFLIDSDLEEKPELLGEFYSRLASHPDVDVFFGVQEKRKGGLVERIGGDIFYRFFNKLTHMNLPRSPLTIRAMSSRFVSALCTCEEKELFLAGLFELTGFRQEEIYVQKTSRLDTSYGFWKRLKLLVTAITSFSSFPLLVFFYIGNIISVGAISYALFLFIRKFLNPSLVIEGWTSLMVSVWFLGGVILISCGMIGLYLSRVYNEVKRRPNYIVRDSFGLDIGQIKR